jgi:hypothetical protein
MEYAGRNYPEPSAPHLSPFDSQLNFDTDNRFTCDSSSSRLTTADKISFALLWALAAVTVVALVSAFFVYCW